MINFEPFLEQLKFSPLSYWCELLYAQSMENLESPNADMPKWIEAIQNMPPIEPSSINLNLSEIKIGDKQDCDDPTRAILEKALRELHPWRKGPFDLFDIFIDTEWRSDMKWQRLLPRISSLKDKTVLDVGCGSGYHCWRMRGAGAKFVLGIDPTLLFVMQFWAIQKYINDFNVGVLPLGIDDLPLGMTGFDTVFSMGILYHRRVPLEHLSQLKGLLKPGGQLILETLIIEGGKGELLSPGDRYAKMPNVRYIPSIETLEFWLNQAGFEEVKLINVSQTTFEEQRSTDWMRFESLKDYLDPTNHNLTIEGYPAPKRAIFIANNS